MKQKQILAVTGLALRGKQFLLTRRNQPSTPIWHDKWNIPGGAIEWGEKPEQALVREFMEELGVTPKLLYPHPLPVTALWYGKDTGGSADAHILLLCYLVDIGAQKIDLTLDPEGETSEARWLTLDETKKLDTLPHTIETIKKALEVIAIRGII